MKKRVLLVTTSYPSRGEGEAAAGVFVRDFGLALHAEKIDVQVVAPADASGKVQESGIRVARFAAPRLPLSLLNPARPSDWPAILSTLVAGQNAVIEACDEFRPDHILALWALPSGAWAQRAGRRYGIPFSTWALGSDIWSLGKIPLMRQYLGHVMARAEHRFADGFQLSRDAARLAGQACEFLPSARIFGPPQARRPSSTPPYRIAFLGRWHTNKGIDILLEALANLDADTWKHISAVRIHGGGPLEALVTRHIEALRGCGRPVEPGGYLDIQGARDLFGWADFIVLPSRIESIPVVFSDAMQAGRPVIATPVGDLPRLLESHLCGLLAANADPPSLTAAIRDAIAVGPGRFQAGIAHAAAEFDVHATAQRFLDTIY